MTPERLYKIREVVSRIAYFDPNAGAHLMVLSAHVDHLTAENARLRAGIETISSVSWDVVHPTWVKYMCRTLLNPTEGGQP